MSKCNGNFPRLDLNAGLRVGLVDLLTGAFLRIDTVKSKN